MSQGYWDIFHRKFGEFYAGKNSNRNWKAAPKSKFFVPAPVMWSKKIHFGFLSFYGGCWSIPCSSSEFNCEYGFVYFLPDYMIRGRIKPRISISIPSCCCSSKLLFLAFRRLSDDIHGKSSQYDPEFSVRNFARAINLSVILYCPEEIFGLTYGQKAHRRETCN